MCWNIYPAFSKLNPYSLHKFNAYERSQKKGVEEMKGKKICAEITQCPDAPS